MRLCEGFHSPQAAAMVSGVIQRAFSLLALEPTMRSSWRDIMKKIAAAAIAATLGLAAIAATTTSASADHWHGNSAGAFAAGTMLGLGVGVLAAQPTYVVTPRYVRQADWNAHVDYCFDRHATYDPHTDTYINHRGQIRRCFGSY
jgi:hypothetical protein